MGVPLFLAGHSNCGTRRVGPSERDAARNLLLGSADGTPRDAAAHNLEVVVLYTLAVILLILWLLGMVSGYTIGAFIHVLLVIAIVLILVQLITGRRVSL